MIPLIFFLTLTWTDNSSNEQGFEIFRKAPGGSNYFKIATVPANTTRYRDQGPKWWERYCYFVAAFNAAGRSETDESCNTSTK
mgnify:CR=1 FL=1